MQSHEQYACTQTLKSSDSDLLLTSPIAYLIFGRILCIWHCNVCPVMNVAPWVQKEHCFVSLCNLYMVGRTILDSEDDDTSLRGHVIHRKLQVALSGREREIESLRRQLDAAQEELAVVVKEREVILRENRRLQDDLATMTRENQVCAHMSPRHCGYFSAVLTVGIWKL